MMLKNKLINNLIKVSIAFTLGILAGFNLLVFAINNFTFLTEIKVNPIDFISILINIFLVIFVARILNKRSEEERVEKDLLIERLKDFQTNLDTCIHGFFLEDKLLFTSVVAKLKVIRTDFNLICNLLKKYDFIVGESDVCNDIDCCIRDIKDLFTDTPRSGEVGKGDIEISMNEISLGTENRTNIEDKNIRIKEQIFNLVVLINRKS